MSMAEQILYRAHPPMFRNAPLGFVVSMLLAGAVVGIFILLAWYVRSRSELLTVTPEELRHATGFLAKRRSAVRLSSIRSIKIRQTVAQRLFGTGDIEVYTKEDSLPLAIRGVPDPHEVRELVLEHS
jgi:uncharacterized membrane protein YdbT with pleckstrin-like domain